MRAFIAAELPQDIKDELFELQKCIKGAKARFVAKKNLHLTLKFLGEINKEQLETVKQKLEGIKFNSIQTGLDKIGVFPNESKPRVAWASLKNEREIIKLQREIDQELLPIAKEETRFKAHLTIGRIKFIKSKEEFKDSMKGLKIRPLQFEIKSFKLMESILSKDGPTYHTIDEYNLR